MSYEGRRFYLPLPPATKTLFLINVAVFLLNTLLLGRLSESARPGAIGWFAFSWATVFDGYGLSALRVLTYQFTHSFHDVWHVLMNMVSLWVFGPIAESRLGRGGTLRLYLWGGVLGAVGHVVSTSLAGRPGVSVVGASGACYALLVYAACTAPRLEIVFMVVRMQLWLLASLLCFVGVYSTFVEIANGYDGSGVAHSAHLGGALLGWLAFRRGWFIDYADFGGRARPGFFAAWSARWRNARAARQQRASDEREQNLDAILAKVKATGLGSLTPAERRFLEQISAQKGQRR